jgi:hypothetical protein
VAKKGGDEEEESCGVGHFLDFDGGWNFNAAAVVAIIETARVFIEAPLITALLLF